MAMAATSTITCYIKLSSFLLLLFVGIVSAQLFSYFYTTSCASVLSTINSTVNSAVKKEGSMGASFLGLHFHDCFVQGCDASILLNDTSNFRGERMDVPNVNSLRGFDVIDTIKSQLERKCPGVVSCADIVAVAARDSVVALGGPSWPVLLGRTDSTTSSLSEANSDLPDPSMDLNDLISTFFDKGFNTQEMVALSGAHTIGEARCKNFRTRVYIETNINSTFAESLQTRCPSIGGDSRLSPLDTTTPDLFDNDYFKNLVNKKGLLHSDQQLFNGVSTNSPVSAYSKNADTFRIDFANAMVKMGNINSLTGSSGEIRTNCRVVNS